MDKENIVAIVRRRQDFKFIEKALSDPITNIYFVCLSVDTYLYCKEHSLSVITMTEFPSLERQNFTESCLHLAREWIEASSGSNSLLSADEKMHLSTQFVYFFSTALFAYYLIKAIVEKDRPTKVFIWTDREKPMIGNWAPGESEGSVFSQVAAEYLTEQGIPYEFIKSVGRSETIRKTGSQYYSNLVSCAGFRYLVYLGVKITRFELFLKLARFYIKRVLLHYPIILFWGSHVDAIFQAELARQWSKERGWIAIRFEGLEKVAFENRRKSRGAESPLGIDQAKVLLAYGDLNSLTSHIDEKEILSTVKSWSQQKYPELRTVLVNPRLDYQYLSMVRNIIFFKKDIGRFIKVIKKINPDCVITHLDTPVAIAARQSNIPSIVVAHGGILTPYLVSMQGDVNIVAGELIKKYFEEVNQFTGEILDIGWPHIQLSSKMNKGLTSEDSGSRQIENVTIFVGQIDFYCWIMIDFRKYYQLCHDLAAKAYTSSFNLIVKLHPRSTEEEKEVYMKLFQVDGERIRLENTPHIDQILAKTDLALFTCLTTAIIEAFNFQIPSILLFYPYSIGSIADWFNHTLLHEIPSASDWDHFEELFKLMLTSEAYRATCIQRQNALFYRLLKSYGDTASHNIAEVCQKLMTCNKINNSKSYRHTKSFTSKAS